jgi:hypothetical protein
MSPTLKTGEVHTVSWYGNVTEKVPLIISRRRWEDSTKIDFKHGRGFSWLMIVSDGGFL